jgi:hypothetical protein
MDVLDWGKQVSWLQRRLSKPSVRITLWVCICKFTNKLKRPKRVTFLSFKFSLKLYEWSTLNIVTFLWRGLNIKHLLGKKVSFTISYVDLLECLILAIQHIGMTRAFLFVSIICIWSGRQHKLLSGSWSMSITRNHKNTFSKIPIVCVLSPPPPPPHPERCRLSSMTTRARAREGKAEPCPVLVGSETTHWSIGHSLWIKPLA